jgi:molybdopterin/thiamine biosynthesis adenylyltransferase/rhodanese-related sulfurtransferase/molybdopterin converting factor small subunit
MSQTRIRIPTPLRSFTGGADEVAIEGTTVRDLLLALDREHRGILERILDGDGRLRSFVNVFVGESNVKALGGLDAAVPAGAVVSIVPAVAGGSGDASRRRLAELRRAVPEVTPGEARELAASGATLIDVRDPDEVAGGMPAGAVHIGRGFLELRIEQAVPDPSATVLLMCAGGSRSLFAADGLRRLGYEDVRSVAGGFQRWKADGLPIEVPRVLSGEQRERYLRHLTIPEVGEAGQRRLLDGKVLLVGAGGLGSPAAFYLAAAGVGTLGLVDDDVVDRSNLQRQILHTEGRVGTRKVDSAAVTLRALNPDVAVRTYPERLTRDNVEAIFAGHDVVVDGSDNFATRYLVNDACLKLGIPNVHGSVFRFEGQVSVFWPGRKDEPGPCYRCLYPEPPPPELAPSCAEAGVLGVLPGVIGMLEAVETIKILLGIGDVLVSRLLHYDALRARTTEYRVDRDPSCRYCANGSFPGYVDYAEFCSARNAES